MRRSVGTVGWVLSCSFLCATATAEPQLTLKLDLVKEAPQSTFTKPTLAQPTVQPNVIVADNVRAMAVLHSIWRYEKAGLFVAGDRIVKDAAKKKLTGPDVQKLVKVAKAAPSAKQRAEYLKFVSELLHEQFDAIVDASKDQMKAYSDLVGSVSSSLDQFMSDNVSESSERDSIETMVEGMSNAGYGAAHYAAARLAEHATELRRLLGDPSVQNAYGAKDEWDLIAKLSGRPRATVAKEVEIAEAGTELLLWLRHASDPKLKARTKKDNMDAVVARLKKLGAHVIFAQKPAPKLPKPRPLCLPPGSTTPKPCAKLAQKP